MHFDLKSATDCAAHAVFDPAAVMHLMGAREKWDDTVEKAEKENLFIYYSGTDGGTIVRVMVNEEPDPAMIAGAIVLRRNAVLHVPSGRLFAAGLEQVLDAAEPPPKSGDFKVWPEHMGHSVEIPAGDYRLDAYETFRESPGPMGRFAGTLLLGCLVIPAGFVLLALLGPLSLWIPFWKKALIAWGLAAGTFGLFMAGWYVMPWQRKWQREKRAREHAENRRWEKAPYNVLVVLRSLPDDAVRLREPAS